MAGGRFTVVCPHARRVWIDQRRGPRVRTRRTQPPSRLRTRIFDGPAIRRPQPRVWLPLGLPEPWQCGRHATRNSRLRRPRHGIRFCAQHLENALGHRHWRERPDAFFWFSARTFRSGCRVLERIVANKCVHTGSVALDRLGLEPARCAG